MGKDEWAVLIALASACLTGWMAILHWRRDQRETEAARREKEAENPSFTFKTGPYDATGYIWKAVVRINNQSRHIVKDIELRVLGDPWDVATVEIKPRPDPHGHGLILVDREPVASSKRNVVIDPKAEDEACFHLMVDRDGSYTVEFEIAYVIEREIEERVVEKLVRRIDMPPAGYSNPLIPPRE
jgi:hypothetical protein